MQSRTTRMTSVLAAFAIGGLIGAGVALLMAPKAGEETRAMLRDKGYEIKDRAVGAVEDTRNRAGKAIENVTHETKRATGALKEGSQRLVDRGKEKIHEVRGS